MYFLCQAEDGVRAARESRVLGEVYKGQLQQRWAVLALRRCLYGFILHHMVGGPVAFSSITLPHLALQCCG